MGGRGGGTANSSVPWSTSPQPGCQPPPDILSFPQMRHPQLCLSRAALHRNAARCLAQKKKSGSGQKAMLWQRKTGGISDTTNFISYAQPLNCASKRLSDT